MIQLFLKISLLGSIFLLVGCQTSTHLNSGIQRGFEAVNPAAIVATPIFALPDPSSEKSSVDLSLLETEKIIPILEKDIIQSNFTNQPNINGYSFSAVKKAIGYQDAQSSNGKMIWNQLNATMKKVANRFSSRNTKVRLLISPTCLARKNYVEFYSYCLSEEADWLSNLNTLSAEVLNADAALITVITDLQDKIVNNKYEIIGGFSVLLVDTNNGKLIWGNDKKETLTNPLDKKYFPKWEDLIQSVFVPDFWIGFPGRIGENQLVSDNSNEGAK